MIISYFYILILWVNLLFNFFNNKGLYFFIYKIWNLLNIYFMEL